MRLWILSYPLFPLRARSFITSVYLCVYLNFFYLCLSLSFPPGASTISGIYVVIKVRKETSRHSIGLWAFIFALCYSPLLFLVMDCLSFRFLAQSLVFCSSSSSFYGYHMHCHESGWGRGFCLFFIPSLAYFGASMIGYRFMSSQGLQGHWEIFYIFADLYFLDSGDIGFYFFFLWNFWWSPEA